MRNTLKVRDRLFYFRRSDAERIASGDRRHDIGKIMPSRNLYLGKRNQLLHVYTVIKEDGVVVDKYGFVFFNGIIGKSEYLRFGLLGRLPHQLIILIDNQPILGLLEKENIFLVLHVGFHRLVIIEMVAKHIFENCDLGAEAISTQRGKPPTGKLENHDGILLEQSQFIQNRSLSDSDFDRMLSGRLKDFINKNRRGRLAFRSRHSDDRIFTELEKKTRIALDRHARVQGKLHVLVRPGDWRRFDDHIHFGEIFRSVLPQDIFDVLQPLKFIQRGCQLLPRFDVGYDNLGSVGDQELNRANSSAVKAESENGYFLIFEKRWIHIDKATLMTRIRFHP